MRSPYREPYPEPRPHHSIEGQGPNYEGYFSLSEQATPRKSPRPVDTPNAGIRFMVAVLSLENVMLKMQIDKQAKEVGLQAIALEHFHRGGGNCGQALLEEKMRDLNYYKHKVTELQLELTKRGPKEPVKQPHQVRINTGDDYLFKENRKLAIALMHDPETEAKMHNNRHKSYYDKKAYQVRQRSLLFHGLLKWLDTSRILNSQSQDEGLLSQLAFHKWSLRCRFKVKLSSFRLQFKNLSQVFQTSFSPKFGK